MNQGVAPVEPKDRLDALVELWKGCWSRIAERRTYEWRTSLTLYAGLATLIWFVGVQLPPERKYLAVVAIIPVVALPLLHSRYLRGIGARHSDDRAIAQHYERRLHAILDAPFGKDLEDRLAESTKRQTGLLADWSRSVQVGVSLTLALTAAAIAAGRFICR
jgi:hypothetical protein